MLRNLGYSETDLNSRCFWSCRELEVRRKEVSSGKRHRVKPVSPEKLVDRQVEGKGEGGEG